MKSNNLDIRRFSVDDLLLGNGYDDHTGNLHEAPSWTGWLINQVIRGKSELIEGSSPVYISDATMQTFEELVLREGGAVFEYRHKRQPGHPLTVMRLGRFMVRHKREADGPSQALDEQQGPWGIPATVAYKDEDRARTIFELTRKAFSWLPGEGRVYDKGIEVEWDIPSRLPVPAPGL